MKNKITLLEQFLIDAHGYDSITLEQATGVISYDWCLALRDIMNLGVDVTNLDTENHQGYDVTEFREVSESEYLGRLEKLLIQEVSYTNEQILGLIVSGRLETRIIHKTHETDLMYNLDDVHVNSIALGDSVGIMDMVEIIKNDINGGL